jgi:hypothetical protein
VKAMLIGYRNAYERAATRAILLGEPFETLVDAVRRQAAEEAAAKIVLLADWREKLRHTETTLRSRAPCPQLPD